MRVSCETVHLREPAEPNWIIKFNAFLFWSARRDNRLLIAELHDELLLSAGQYFSINVLRSLAFNKRSFWSIDWKNWERVKKLSSCMGFFGLLKVFKKFSWELMVAPVMEFDEATRMDLKIYKHFYDRTQE